jgi:Flp pilus assembly protein TadD
MSGPGRPAGDPYDWYRRGCDLLESGEAGPAAELLAHVVDADPTSRAGWESLARARFDSRQFRGAAAAFARLTEMAPDDDYAQFGLGLSSWRLGDLTGAAEHLSLAVAMRPDRKEYSRALGQVRATLRARREAAGEPAWSPTEGGPAEDAEGRP